MVNFLARPFSLLSLALFNLTLFLGSFPSSDIYLIPVVERRAEIYLIPLYRFRYSTYPYFIFPLLQAILSFIFFSVRHELSSISICKDVPRFSVVRWDLHWRYIPRLRLSLRQAEGILLDAE